MKSAREGQFRELIAKLLTKVDYTGMDFDEVQKWIKDPQSAASMFVYFVNHAAQLRFDNLYVANRHTEEIVGETQIQPGDTLIFDMTNMRLKIIRVFETDNGIKDLYFKLEDGAFERFIDIKHLESRHEILEACALLGCLIDCKMEVDRSGEDNKVRQELRVKFTYF